MNQLNSHNQGPASATSISRAAAEAHLTDTTSVAGQTTSAAVSSPNVLDPAFLENIESLFHRGEFQKIADSLPENMARESIQARSGPENSEERSSVVSTIVQLELRRVASLYELNRSDEASEFAETLATLALELNSTALALHTRAMVHLLAEDYQQAISTWRSALKGNDAEAIRVPAMIGLATAFLEANQMTNVRQTLDELDRVSTPLTNSQRLDQMLLKARWIGASGGDLELARQKFCEVMSLALRNNWIGYLVKAQFGLAGIANQTGNITTLRAHKLTLDAMIRKSDFLRTAATSERLFASAAPEASSEIDVDHESKRIRIGQKWFDFHKTPMLFNFFCTLHGRSSFITKETVAKTLWPHEIYKPRTHDPRIFNIAKRIREEIEADTQSKVVILSGRFGYKLSISHPANVAAESVAPVAS